MAALFGSAFIDEISLREQAENILSSNRGQLDESLLASVHREHGIDLASVLLHHWLSTYKHREFCAHLDALSSEPEISCGNASLLIVPGMFHKEYPEMGGDGTIIKQIAERNGFNADIVGTHSTGGLQNNADLIRSAILQHKNSQPLWLVSISKGCAETGLCLQQLSDEQKHRIKGWINLCGIFHGSPIADIRLRNPINRYILKAYIAYKGANFATLDEMRQENPLWQSGLANPDMPHAQVIHLQPIPVIAYVHAKLIKRYRQLTPLGVNDGTILLNDLINRPGHIYPLWGVDHFFRDQSVVPLIYKLCRHIKLYEKQRIKDENSKIDADYNVVDCALPI